MSDILYDSFLRDFASGYIDLLGHDIRCALLSEAYAPNFAHSRFAVAADCEVVGDGYIAGGIPLQGKHVEQDGSSTLFAAANLVWPSVTVSARYAMLYDNTVATKPLIGLFDFGAIKVVRDGTFCINFDPNVGVLSMRAE